MADPLEVARESGLVRAGEPLLVLVSGGADSTCLLGVALELGAQVSALHVNHGLREDSDDDERHCRELCERLGVPLAVEGARPGPGNVQAEARALRYALAERHAEGDWATAHTLSDQAETVLYRLAVSPGRGALLAMAPRRGRHVRPLLGAEREDTRRWCEERGLAWREDPSNRDPRFARARIRHEVMPVLRELSPAAERTLAETARRLAEEAEVLDDSAREAAERLGGGTALPLEGLRELRPALARLLLQRAAAAAAGRPVSLSPEEAGRILALGGRGGTVSLDLPGGLRAVGEYGMLRFAAGPDAPPPDPVPLPVPGTARFGAWEVEARPGRGGEVELSGPALGRLLTVRAWREGDRMRPAGLGGGKSLQDLFTDRKVPRALRRTLPVVEAAEGIAWVAGVATGEEFLAREGEPEVVSLSARRGGAPGDRAPIAG